MEILDLLNEESVSSIRREVLLSMFEKVSRSLKYDSNIFFVHKHIYMYINTMAECRSGRKCIAVKWNISDISRVFAWRREISPTDVKYHLTTWNITYQREKSDIAPPLCAMVLICYSTGSLEILDIFHSFSVERRNNTRLRLVRFNRRYTYNSWKISRISLLPVL